MSHKRVAAYITAYEDSQALNHCIKALQSQTYPIEKILIVDNSRSPILLNSASQAKNLVIITCPENIGLSGGLKLGLEWATGQSYDFLWTFDQDSVPKPDCLATLIEQFGYLTQAGNRVGIIAPLPIDSNVKIELPGFVFDRYRFIPSPHQKEHIYECDVVITSGSLVEIAAAKDAELPNQDLFIDGVDWDYCLKLKQKGYQIFLVRNAVIQHRFSNLRMTIFPLTGKEIMINHYSPLRHYYISRNHTYITLRLCNLMNLPFAVSDRLHRILRTVIKIWFYESDQKLLKSWACLLGTYDGFVGRLGKRW
jgi:rhamnosyltransferase